MKSQFKRPLFSIVIIIITSSAMLLCGGCGEEMSWHSIYNTAIGGAVIGGIVGYQSDEPGEGAAVGAAVFGVGELLNQIDRANRPERDDDNEQARRSEDRVREIYIIEIQNDNGSVTPVKIRKKGDIYIGPEGEQYEELPTEEQLRPVYGL